MPHCDGVLDHDTDLLRQLRPAPRARLHDRGRRRAGAAPPPLRRGRLLPDRHRRARRQRRPGRRGRRDAAQGVLRHGVGAVPRAGRGDGVEPRLLHPHHRPRARAPGAGLRAAAEGQGRAVRGHLRRPLLQLVRGVLRRERADPAGQLLPAASQPPGGVGRGAQLVLPAQDLGAEAARAVRREPRVRAPAGPLQRGPLADRRRPGGRLVQPGDRHLGRARCRGSRSRRSTSGSTRCSTTAPRSSTASAATSPRRSGRPRCT